MRLVCIATRPTLSGASGGTHEDVSSGEHSWDGLHLHWSRHQVPPCLQVGEHCGEGERGEGEREGGGIWSHLPSTRRQPH